MGAAAVPALVGTGASGFPISVGLASGAGTGLATGLTAGSILGTGAATTGLLGNLGLNALGGMTSILPAAATTGSSLTLPALASQGLAAAAPAAGIFSQATPALAGLPSTFTGPGLLNTMGMSPLGGMASTVPAGTSLPGAVAPNLVGQNQVLNAFQQAQLNPFKGAELGKVAELGKTSTELASKTPGLDAAVKGYPTTPVPPYNPATDPNLQEALRAQAAKVAAQQTPIVKGENFLSNLGNLIKNPSMQGAKDIAEEHPYATSAVVGLGAQALLGGKKPKAPEQDKGSIRPYEYTRTQRPEAYAVSPLEDTSERLYFDSKFTPLEPYSATSPKAKEIEKIAEGGIAKAYAIGGPVEQMAAMNAVGANTGYPMAGINTAMYSNPMVQRPEAVNVLSPSGDAGVTAYSGEPKFASGGISHLGDYSDGGRLLKGPGDGVSDSIPAVIGKRQPARLADGEFVIPARIVSELGNGSTEAGARKLYAMMDRIQKGRRKSVGKGKVAVDSKSDKHLPA